MLKTFFWKRRGLGDIHGSFGQRTLSRGEQWTTEMNTGRFRIVWSGSGLRPMRSFHTDVLVPNGGIAADVVGEERDALRRGEIDDLDAA
jgi:hypothetical protein